MKIMRNNRI
jgi:DUF218 domain